MANIGDQLTAPETGWKRIQDTDSNIKYVGNGWRHEGHSTYNGGSAHWTQTSGDYCILRFYGSKFRLISLVHSKVTTNNKIIIDDEEYEYNAYNIITKQQILLFEKKDLDNEVHIIKIYGNDYINCIDAIDIDKDGYMVYSPKMVGDALKTPESDWQRIDKFSGNIVFSSGWVSWGNGSFYGGAMYYTNKVGAYFKFKFYGKKIRFISTNKITSKILIDGVEYSSLFPSSTSINKYDTGIVYENLELNEGIHDILVTNTSGEDLLIDAIDINEEGYVLACVGSILTEPETGWKRIDDSDEKISYIGNWIAISDNNEYNSTMHSSVTAGDKILFYFMGNKIRIISRMCSYKENNVTKLPNIIIDDETNVFTEYSSGNLIYNRIVFENNDLTNRIHRIQIINNSSRSLTLDAVDINEEGCLISDSYYERYANGKLIKTRSSLIGDLNYSLNSNLIELRDNYNMLNNDELNAKVGVLRENYTILKIK